MVPGERVRFEGSETVGPGGLEFAVTRSGPETHSPNSTRTSSAVDPANPD